MSPLTPIYNAAENRYVRNDSLAGGESVLRQRFTAAQVNAGIAVLPAVVGFIYALIGVSVIPIGGAATGLTALVLLGTRAAAPVTLVSVLAAALTQSTRVSINSANVTILADGASFTPLDVNTPVTIGVTGSPMTVATNLDVAIEYTLLPA